jgi:HD superfamily phosphohydrolase
MQVVVNSKVDQNPSKEDRALAAALVHDVGHGPFSHAFEKVGKRLGLVLADHEKMSDVIVRRTEIADVLNQMGSGFADDVAHIIKKEGARTVHHAVVTSQFDADRLDYMQRDRMMTGSQHSMIDFVWLIANLEIGEVAAGVDETSLGTVKTFVLGPKAVYAAEAYVLGLFQLYQAIFFHKTTRGAEVLFLELICRAIELARAGSVTRTGLAKNHPLIRFASKSDDLELALGLDDGVINGAIAFMCDAPDPMISDFAKRLRDRKLYKCIDIRTIVAGHLDPKLTDADEVVVRVDTCCEEISQKLEDWSKKNSGACPRILIDIAERSPYRSFGETAGPLDRINIRLANSELVDLKERSRVVATLKTFKICRAYHDREDNEAISEITKTVEEAVKS